MDKIEIWRAEWPSESYRLLDSGEKEKLEEIGGQKIRRSEPRAWWPKTLSESDWRKTVSNLETEIALDNFKLQIKYKPASKHVGFFPEQASEWRYIKEKIGGSKKETAVLNLFGYTGLASLAAASAGAQVTHVDASKPSIDWARHNQKISGLERAPIRWILDDVLKFLKREIRQGKKYDAVIMDPPSYGRGPEGEIWKIEKDLPALLSTMKNILSDSPLFIICNLYATELSPIAVGNFLEQITDGLPGKLRVGELTLPEANSNRLLPMSIFALWEGE